VLYILYNIILPEPSICDYVTVTCDSIAIMSCIILTLSSKIENKEKEKKKKEMREEKIKYS